MLRLVVAWGNKKAVKSVAGGGVEALNLSQQNLCFFTNKKSQCFFGSIRKGGSKNEFSNDLSSWVSFLDILSLRIIQWSLTGGRISSSETV